MAIYKPFSGLCMWQRFKCVVYSLIIHFINDVNIVLLGCKQGLHNY